MKDIVFSNWLDIITPELDDNLDHDTSQLPFGQKDLIQTVVGERCGCASIPTHEYMSSGFYEHKRRNKLTNDRENLPPSNLSSLTAILINSPRIISFFASSSSRALLFPHRGIQRSPFLA